MATIHGSFFSQAMLRTVNFCAVIPLDHQNPEEEPGRGTKLKTLYLLHGATENEYAWMENTRVARWALEKNLAVIMPSGENKFFLDHPQSHDFFGRLIGEELVDFSRKLFPLSEKREDTFICGDSMGGYGAMLNAMHYCNVFGYAGALSGGLHITDLVLRNPPPTDFILAQTDYLEAHFGDLEQYPGSGMDILAATQKVVDEGNTLPAIYLAVGNDDHQRENTQCYCDFLAARGIPFTLDAGPGRHEWEYFDEHFKKFLEWLPI